jgi:CheY-like chemotaxis protein
METILVVDDEPTVLTLCQRVLNLGGYSVLPANGGEAALRVVAQNSETPIDLALLDVMMPVMNGVELARRIQKLSPATKIVLMSGFGPKEIGAVVGQHPYRLNWKPFKTESLLQMIENALAS